MKEFFSFLKRNAFWQKPCNLVRVSALQRQKKRVLLSRDALTSWKTVFLFLLGCLSSLSKKNFYLPLDWQETDRLLKMTLGFRLFLEGTCISRRRRRKKSSSGKSHLFPISLSFVSLCWVTRKKWRELPRPINLSFLAATLSKVREAVHKSQLLASPPWGGENVALTKYARRTDSQLKNKYTRKVKKVQNTSIHSTRERTNERTTGGEIVT